jgi:hypothetical protein
MTWRDALPELLFSEKNTFENLEERKAEIRRTVAALDREEIAGGNANELVAKIVARHAVGEPAHERR